MPYIAVYEPAFDIAAQIEISEETAAKARKAAGGKTIIRIMDCPDPAKRVLPRSILESQDVLARDTASTSAWYPHGIKK